LSGAWVVLGSKVRVDGETRPGTTIDAERILGLDDSKVQPRGAVTWRFGRHHELETGYQFIRRDAENTITEDFVFRDSTYRAGSRVRTTFNSDQLFLNYRYAFRVRDRSEYGFGLGFGALFFDINLDALTGVSGGGGGPTVQFSRSNTFVGPTASVGLYGKWRIGGKSYVGSDLRAIKLNIGDLDATITEGGLGYRYFLSPRYGLEAGYGISSIHLDIKSTSAAGTDRNKIIKYSLQNLRLGLVAAL
jgi:hypothetical protein